MNDRSPPGLEDAAGVGRREKSRRRRRGGQPASSLIRVELDPGTGGGYNRNRYDLEVRGRIVSSAPVEAAELLHGEQVVARVEYGADDAGVETLLESGPARQVTFHFDWSIERDEAAQRTTCAIAVRMRDGQSHVEQFDVSIEPTAAPPLLILSGPTCSAADYVDVLPSIRLHVERVALDAAGLLQVQGWAVSLAPIVTIQSFIGDDRVGVADLGELRDDVAGAFPAYHNAPTSGFSLFTEIGPRDATSIRVQAISAGGAVQEVKLPLERVRDLRQIETVIEMPVPPSPDYKLSVGFQILPAAETTSDPSPVLTDPRRRIRMYCDDVTLQPDGQLKVQGWAVSAVGIAAVTIEVDGVRIGNAEVGLLREDVGQEYGSIPLARYAGFHFATRLQEFNAGEHQIRVVVKNGMDDSREDVRTLMIERVVAQPETRSTEFRCEIDTPRIVDGVAADPVTGRLTIEGWALARSGVASIDVLLNGDRLGEAHYGMARQDVGAAFGDWPDSLRSGFAYHCPPRSLHNGRHAVRLDVHARNGDVTHYDFTIEVRKSAEHEDVVSLRRRISEVESGVAAHVLRSIVCRPNFRIMLRMGTQDEAALQTTLASLRGQVYRDWTLTIIDAEARQLVDELADDIADRISIGNETDWSASADAPDAWVGFLSAGDELGCDALLEFALASGLHPGADLLYGDELRVSPASQKREPFCKPDFSPDLLLSTNYIGRPWFAKMALLHRAGLTLASVLEHGEYDAVLRCTELAASIHHIPKIMCQRGAGQIDDLALEELALTRAAERRGIAAEPLAGCIPGTWRLRRAPSARGLVSIIIPTCAARGYIETCVKTLRERTAYQEFEIVCLDNIPDDQLAWKIWLKRNVDRVVPMPGPFNWSQFNNAGAAAAKGEYLLFLNDDVEVQQADWLDVMLEHVHRPEVAVVGPQLLYPDGTVQHAGMFLATPGTARHAFRFAAADDPGYFGLALTQRNVIAVTGACMLMRRSMFEALGGFDEAHQIINNDLDLCLRAHRHGKLIVYTPHASLIHHEAISRDSMTDDYDLHHFEARWKTLFAAGDPYFSPLLTRNSDDYRPDDEPVEAVYSGHPIFRRDEVKRILAVKVDHIGDFITAIPALRRLKQIFPTASLYVLASRAVQAFATALDCIDGFIEFEFFHAVSGLGQKEIGKDEYLALREQLASYQFDLAVDLRKHPETREVLRHVPARILAGFDLMGQFPFLHIALEWERDQSLQRKRSHVSDDFLNLVEAIGTACGADRQHLELPAASGGPPEFLEPAVRALFDKPVVAVHPGVGNALRQWPVEHFAALIDLLVERNAVNIVVIGSPDEMPLTEQVLAQVLHTESVANLAGKTLLRDLPALLAACALYLGNDSGPKHIAAALSVPTIGIHSGVVDATQWGPIGRQAAAVWRNMSCSPCYFSRMEDCPRDFACMRGLHPTSVHAVAELFLARPIEPRTVEPLVEQPAETMV
jgi:O-antigen biosynthesis protein